MSNKHFKLREDLSIEVYGVKLFRIEATRDIKHCNVKVGDLGGYIENEKNLRDNAWVSGNAKVFGNACVYDNAWVFGDAEVWDDAEVCDYARVYGNAKLRCKAAVAGNAHVCDNAQVSGNAAVSGVARVYDRAWVYRDAEVCDYARVSGDADVVGDKIKSSSDCKNILNEKYNITILPELLKIGCKCHTKKEWWNFSDSEIIEMGGKDGLQWWKKWKPILMAICEAESEVKDEQKVSEV